jgi:uncharacterized protein (TIGR00288 family)
MANDGGTVAGRRIALLIDADNVSHTQIGAILAELSARGTVNIRRAYGDWGSPQLAGWKAQLHEFAIRPIQQFSYTTGKNATDIALVIDAMELLYTQKLDGFCIASSDADFTPLVMQLKANGHEVYGFGERKTPAPFVNACTTFLYLEAMAEAGGPPKEPAPANAPAPQNAEKPAAPVPKPSKTKVLASDTKLVMILRGAVEATKRDDGWATLASAGSAVRRQAPIDPRNYDKRNFSTLFEATGLFEIVKGSDGLTYIADKRNKDHADKPKP